jgi:hypothetical protein
LPTPELNSPRNPGHGIVDGTPDLSTDSARGSRAAALAFDILCNANSLFLTKIIRRRGLMCQAKRDFGNSLGNFDPEKYGEYQFGIPAGGQKSNVGLIII